MLCNIGCCWMFGAKWKYFSGSFVYSDVTASVINLLAASLAFFMTALSCLCYSPHCSIRRLTPTTQPCWYPPSPHFLLMLTSFEVNIMKIPRLWISSTVEPPNCIRTWKQNFPFCTFFLKPQPECSLLTSCFICEQCEEKLSFHLKGRECSVMTNTL